MTGNMQVDKQILRMASTIYGQFDGWIEGSFSRGIAENGTTCSLKRIGCMYHTQQSNNVTLHVAATMFTMILSAAITKDRYLSVVSSNSNEQGDLLTSSEKANASSVQKAITKRTGHRDKIPFDSSTYIQNKLPNQSFLLDETNHNY